MTRRIRLFGVEIDAVRMPQAVSRVLQRVRQPDGRCHFVVTPNVDHTILLQRNEALREAYGEADLVLADGTPVVLASRLLGHALPERVAGADLAPALFDAAEADRPLRIFLLGAAPGVAERAAENIHRRWPAVRVVGTYSPPLGFEHDEAENTRILERLAAAGADVVVVGLGAPKQELWVHQHHRRIKAAVVLCVGATIDFLAGTKPRAPAWMRRAGLEWLHRLGSEPRRLLGRYAHDAWVFPQLVWRQWRTQRSLA